MELNSQIYILTGSLKVLDSHIRIQPYMNNSFPVC